MLKSFTPVQKTAGLFFLSLSFCYAALTPGTIVGRGYLDEEMASGNRMLDVMAAWIRGAPIPPMMWSRHGPIPVLFDLPFIAFGRFFISSDFILSLQSIVLTSALITILFLWLLKLCSPRMSLVLSLTCAFGTMLWPYAYIGLEPKQSLLVLLAGYLALASGKIRGWFPLMGFAVVCGLALTIKSTGVVMAPAFAYLLYVQFREDWRERLGQLPGVCAVVVVFIAVGIWGRDRYWVPLGGGAQNLKPWFIDSPFQFFSNTIGVFGSPTKGLLVYAPILLVSLVSLAAAFRRHRHICVFAVLVAATYGGFVSVLKVTADELWGSRYMHASIALLVLCIGAAWPRFEWRKHAPIVVLAIAGVVISFLGAIYYYGFHEFAMQDSRQNTLEAIYGDPVWNEIAFDARLFRVWIEDRGAPVPWTPSHVWVWQAPPGTQPPLTINLRDYCAPQSILLKFWNLTRSGNLIWIFRVCLLSLVLGPLLLLWTIGRIVRADQSGRT